MKASEVINKYADGERNFPGANLHRIASLETAINLALQRPSFYAENCHNQGETNMSSDRYVNTEGGKYHEGNIDNYGNYAERDQYNSLEQKQNLADAATEIQQLLEKLEKNHSTDTTMGKMSIATEAIQHIDSNPKLTSRVLSALQAGSTSELDSFLDHPAASFVISALEDWQQSKGGK